MCSEPGMYDGLTVDATGAVWSALWDHGAVVRHDSTGAVRRTAAFPVRNATSLTFAGPAYTTAYVTTAAHDAAEDDEDAGALFRLDPGAEGVPEFRSKVSVRGGRHPGGSTSLVALRPPVGDRVLRYGSDPNPAVRRGSDRAVQLLPRWFFTAEGVLPVDA